MAQDPLIIVQARLGSKRLPGKVLMPIKGRPMLAYLLDRLPDEAVVATPDHDIALFARDEGKRAFCWDGPQDDVAGRFAACLEAYEHPDTFIRLCADSPLMDYALIEAAMALYSGTYLRITSPVGSVQMIDTAEWRARGLVHKEHVIAETPFLQNIYVWPEEYQRLVVDTAEDFARVSAVIEKMTEPHWSYNWRQVCELL